MDKIQGPAPDPTAEKELDALLTDLAQEFARSDLPPNLLKLSERLQSALDARAKQKEAVTDTSQT